VPDQDATLGCRDDLLDADILLAWKKRDIRHPLKLYAAPGVGK